MTVWRFAVAMAFGLAVNGEFSPMLANDAQTAARLANARYLSYAARDLPLSAAEVEAVIAGQKGSDLLSGWLSSTAHRMRVWRFFYDFLGQPLAGAGGGHEVEATDGILHLLRRDPCSEADSSLVNAWWSAEPVRICNNSISTSMTFGTEGTDDFVNCQWPNKIYTDARCGCGPDLILCSDRSRYGQYARDLAEMPLHRAVYAYEQDLSWEDLFANGQLFANRNAFHTHLFTNVVDYLQEMPSAAEREYLQSLSLTEWQMGRFPLTGPARANYVTDPHFMLAFNNPRSRVRELSLSLLCQDVTGALNTDGITEFVNPELSAETLAHGQKAGCASCHYALDNLASTIRGWSQIAVFVDNEGTNQLGHAFGAQGSGPTFLMESIVKRGPGFHRCMAKRAWESFSGYLYADLDEGSQGSIEEMARSGPRALIRGILGSDLLQNQR